MYQQLTYSMHIYMYKMYWRCIKPTIIYITENNDKLFITHMHNK